MACRDAFLGLKDGHDVAVYVAAPIRDVQPDSQRVHQERHEQYFAPGSLRSQGSTAYGSQKAGAYIFYTL